MYNTLQTQLNSFSFYNTFKKYIHIYFVISFPENGSVLVSEDV